MWEYYIRILAEISDFKYLGHLCSDLDSFLAVAILGEYLKVTFSDFSISASVFGKVGSKSKFHDFPVKIHFSTFSTFLDAKR